MKKHEFQKQNQITDFKLSLKKENFNDEIENSFNTPSNYNTTKNSHSPNQTNRNYKFQKTKNSNIQNSKSPQFRISKELISNENKNFFLIKKEKINSEKIVNIIPGDEEDLKRLKECKKENLPKEKTYIITETNYQKVIELIKGKERNEKEIVELNKKNNEVIKLKDEKINKLEQTNKSIITRNNQLINEIKKKKKEYDELTVEIKKYENTFSKLILLIKYILSLYNNDNKIQEKIKELKLDNLLEKNDEDTINISDLISKEQNEINIKYIETNNQLRDIEDMKYLIDTITNDNFPQNELINQLSEKTKRIFELIDKYEKLEKNYINIKAKYNNLISENNEQINQQRIDISVCQNQIANLTKEKISLNNDNEKLKSKIENLENKINNINNNEKYQSSHSDNNLYNNNTQKIQELNLIINDKENSINEYKKQIEYLQKENEQINQSKINLQKEIEIKNNKINELELNLNNKKKLNLEYQDHPENYSNINNFNNKMNDYNITNDNNNFNDIFENNENFDELNNDNDNNYINNDNLNINFNINNFNVNNNNNNNNNYNLKTNKNNKDNNLNNDKNENLYKIHPLKTISQSKKIINSLEEDIKIQNNNNNNLRDAKFFFDIKLLRKKIEEDKRNMYFVGENKEVGINGITYIGDLFLDLYNQSKLVEEIIDKSENLINEN